jgi:hypothetical protein
MRRKILIVVVVVLMVAVIGSFLVLGNLGRIVKFGVEQGGSLALGVPVRLEDAKVSVSAATLTLDGLTVGSPEGFGAPYMFELAHASATVDVGSLRSDLIVIKDVTVDAPRVTLEFSGGSTNWGVLLAHLKKPAAQPSKKKMQIGHLVITNGKLAIAGVPVAGTAAVPLPPVDVHDVGGGASGGASVQTVLTDVVSSLYLAIGEAAKQVVPAQQLEALGGEARSQLGNAGSAAQGAAGKATQALKGLLGGSEKKGN